MSLIPIKDFRGIVTNADPLDLAIGSYSDSRDMAIKNGFLETIQSRFEDLTLPVGWNSNGEVIDGFITTSVSNDYLDSVAAQYNIIMFSTVYEKTEYENVYKTTNGTVSCDIVIDSVIVEGIGTFFTNFSVGDRIKAGGVTREIFDIISNTRLEVTSAYTSDFTDEGYLVYETSVASIASIKKLYYSLYDSTNVFSWVELDGVQDNGDEWFSDDALTGESTYFKADNRAIKIYMAHDTFWFGKLNRTQYNTESFLEFEGFYLEKLVPNNSVIVGDIRLQGEELSLAGTISNGSFGNYIIGTGTSFLTDIIIGDTLIADGKTGWVSNVVDDTSLRLSAYMPITSGSTYTTKRFTDSAVQTSSSLELVENGTELKTDGYVRNVETKSYGKYRYIEFDLSDSSGNNYEDPLWRISGVKPNGRWQILETVISDGASYSPRRFILPSKYKDQFVKGTLAGTTTPWVTTVKDPLLYSADSGSNTATMPGLHYVILESDLANGDTFVVESTNKTIDDYGFTTDVIEMEFVYAIVLDDLTEVIVEYNSIEDINKSDKFALKLDISFGSLDPRRVTKLRYYVKTNLMLDFEMVHEVDLISEDPKKFSNIYLMEGDFTGITLTQNVGYYLEKDKVDEYKIVNKFKDVAFVDGYGLAIADNNLYHCVVGGGNIQTDLFYATNLINVAQGEFLVAIKDVNNNGLVFTKRTAYFIVVASSEGIPVFKIQDVIDLGIDKVENAIEVQGGVIVLAYDGIYLTNGYTKELLSSDINDKIENKNDAERSFDNDFIWYDAYAKILYYKQAFVEYDELFQLRFIVRKWERLSYEDEGADLINFSRTLFQDRIRIFEDKIRLEKSSNDNITVPSITFNKNNFGSIKNKTIRYVYLDYSASHDCQLAMTYSSYWLNSSGVKQVGISSITLDSTSSTRLLRRFPILIEDRKQFNSMVFSIYAAVAGTDLKLYNIYLDVQEHPEVMTNE